jgi:hypothetical protein
MINPLENSDQSGLSSPITGAIPSRSPSMSELVELKIMCRDAKSDLEGVYAAIQTLNMGDGFEHADEIMDDAGHLIDAIQEYCQRSLKRMDAKKR